MRITITIDLGSDWEAVQHTIEDRHVQFTSLLTGVGLTQPIIGFDDAGHMSVEANVPLAAADRAALEALYRLGLDIDSYEVAAIALVA